MRLLPYWLSLGIVLSVLFIGAGMASAQNQPKQYGGGYVQGAVYGYNMWDELIPIDWAEITASNDIYTFRYSSYADGSYGFYLPTGTFNLTVDEPGFVAQSRTIAVSDGSATTGFNFFLQRSNVPIPEFPTQFFAVLMIIAIAGALIAKRTIKRRNR
ncbi:hypothetical protein A3K71_07580 [archaeon RBG_16_50_20]|nr:MAG: hypothetical protein A3K71_07580 [archaeon RBG_16_50_20]